MARVGSSGVGLIRATIWMLLELPLLVSFCRVELDIIEHSKRAANDRKMVTMDRKMVKYCGQIDKKQRTATSSKYLHMIVTQIIRYSNRQLKNEGGENKKGGKPRAPPVYFGVPAMDT